MDRSGQRRLCRAGLHDYIGWCVCLCCILLTCFFLTPDDTASTAGTSCILSGACFWCYIFFFLTGWTSLALHKRVRVCVLGLLPSPVMLVSQHKAATNSGIFWSSLFGTLHLFFGAPIMLRPQQSNQFRPTAPKQPQHNRKFLTITWRKAPYC